MIKNYIKIAWRNLKHDLSFAALNILSLTIGLTFSLLLFYYVKDELSFDTYHEKGDRIYRINSELMEPEKSDLVAISPMVMAPALKTDYEEVEHAVRLLSGNQKTLLKHNGQEAFIEKVFYADSNSFSVFTYPFIVGDPTTALIEPNSIVLSESTALKYFSKPEDALGKALEGEGTDVYKVTGVMEDVPENSHILFNSLISISSLEFLKNVDQQWGNFGTLTYVLLKPGANVSSFEDKLSNIYPTYQKSIFEQFNVTMKYSVIPITDIHLKSTLKYEPEPLGNINYVYTFSTIAILLLLIACINYMNLTTARSARRAKEIGIRKVSGSVQSQLVAQFLTESMLLSFISFALSMVLIAVLLPSFNEISGKSFSFSFILQPLTLLYTLGIVLFAGFIGGSYPAFFLSKFNPLVVLKGKLSKASSNAGLRKSLVVIQFTVAIVMLISTWVIYNQLNYLQNRDLGYDKENILVVSLPSVDSRSTSTLDYIKSEALQNPKIKAVSTSFYTPGTTNQNYNLFEVETEDGFASQGIDNFGVDEDYLDNFGMELAEGRQFRLTDRPDSCINVLVNEAFVKKMNWGTGALGKRIKNQGNEAEPYLYVIGVVKDFHMRSIYNPIEPLMMTYTHDNGSMQFKIDGQDVASSIASIETIFKKSFPKEAMEYSFASEDFKTQFESDQKRGQLFSTFSGLTIILAFLGLLGLIAYTTQQRKKEIAVRKVMGAESHQIVFLLAKNFMILVGVSCLIAFPLSYYFLDQWLDSFTFRTSINPMVFAYSALIILTLTMLAVAYHSIKAALGNQVNAMRIE
ncbi:ABC transporter permease [Arcticibacterium luteifluviistationis]|uniref:ABC transporter permease n=1 Tax=Arcticibacterium luteifluviistationis TaxID=1784714 RepID=A0A2Z4GG80_9BACT|nr:ABC transporter permease [Arcticibacterium luteifluviistationis]AWW00009.1 ABC transporter permease [Arcticibacterium luteifluviistationis]